MGPLPLAGGKGRRVVSRNHIKKKKKSNNASLVNSRGKGIHGGSVKEGARERVKNIFNVGQSILHLSVKKGKKKNEAPLAEETRKGGDKTGYFSTGGPHHFTICGLLTSSLGNL